MSVREQVYDIAKSVIESKSKNSITRWKAEVLKAAANGNMFCMFETPYCDETLTIVAEIEIEGFQVNVNRPLSNLLWIVVNWDKVEPGRLQQYLKPYVRNKTTLLWEQ